MATLPSVALMFHLQTKHLGDQSLLVFLDKIAALLVPPHRLLRAIGLFLASHHLRQQQKKHLRQWQLGRGYSGIVNQNAKVSLPCALLLTTSLGLRIRIGILNLSISCRTLEILIITIQAHQPGPDRIRTIWEVRHFRHCSTPVILSVKIPRPARGTSVGKLIEIANSATKCFSQDGQDSYSEPLSQISLPYLPLNSMVIHGAGGVNGARNLHGKARVLIFTLVFRMTDVYSK